MRNERGFTLMEVLLAATLFAIVMTSGFGVFRMGIQIWRRMQDGSSSDRKIILNFEKMGRDLRGALALPLQDQALGKSKIEYGGSNFEFSFPAIVTKAGKKGEEITQIGRVAYGFDSASKGLCKKTENATDLYLKRKVACETMAGPVQSVKFQYWLYDEIGKEYDWYDEWDSKRGLPKAIRLTFAQVPKKTGQKKEYNQTWFIPAGGAGA